MLMYFPRRELQSTGDDDIGRRDGRSNSKHENFRIGFVTSEAEKVHGLRGEAGRERCSPGQAKNERLKLKTCSRMNRPTRSKSHKQSPTQILYR